MFSTKWSKPEQQPLSFRNPKLFASLPLRRHNLRLAPARVSTTNRNPTGYQREGFLNLRLGKKILKRTMTKSKNSVEKNEDMAVAVDGNVVTPESKAENSCVNVFNIIVDDSDSDNGHNAIPDFTVRVSTSNQKRRSDSAGSQHEDFLTLQPRGLAPTLADGPVV
ncbi:hypothetical protein HKD37_14G041206 [Glycine soja]